MKNKIINGLRDALAGNFSGATFIGADLASGKDWNGTQCPRCFTSHRWRKRRPPWCRSCGLEFRYFECPAHTLASVWIEGGMTMSRAKQAALRLQGALDDPDWRPGRSHIEQARNELALASQREAAMLAALNAAMNWFTPPNDSGPFPAKQIVDAIDAAHT